MIANLAPALRKQQRNIAVLRQKQNASVGGMFGAVILSKTMAVVGMKAGRRVDTINSLGDERAPQCIAGPGQ